MAKKIKPIVSDVWNKYSVRIDMYDAKGNYIDVYEVSEIVAKDALSAVNFTVREAAGCWDELAGYTLMSVTCDEECVNVAT